MKILLEIQDSHAPFMMELLKSLEYVNIVGDDTSPETMQRILDLAEALKEVKAYENGITTLKSAKAVLDEL